MLVFIKFWINDYFFGNNNIKKEIKYGFKMQET